MPKINRTYCAVYGCLSNNIKNPDFSFFSIPSKYEIRLRWLQVMARMDLIGSYRYHRVCEEHFQPEDILLKSTRRLLKKNVMPTLKLPVTSAVAQTPAEETVEIKHEIEDSFSEHEDDILEALENRKRQNESDPLGEPSKKIKEENPDPEELNLDDSPKSVFSEMIEEMQKTRCFVSQQDEDEMETTPPEMTTVQSITEASQKFNFKPKHNVIPDIPSVSKLKELNTPPEITVVQPITEASQKFNFKSKPILLPDIPPGSKLKELLTVDVKNNKQEKEVFPKDFMKSVLSSQEEILTILKSQVLLENPDPDLLTFLRLVGMKLSRLFPIERREMQNQIINILNKK
ncbi:uncharacterized protein LOC133526562 [Cydia pomonella]|uniref:uncharacterized protein LOC133526562 n=1 Tax=Cydia pomonella TaxID=82600 RepID=UPI002ADE6EE2|nr:uncharacterized protein LOC133526562 [Cydia pomonella]